MINGVRTLWRKMLFVVWVCCFYSQALAVTTLTQIETYLNSFRSLAGDFEQLTSGGELTQGSIKLLKPGQLILDYNKPATQLIFSDDGILYVYDKATLDVNQLPLDQSLADVLLAEFIMINEDVFTITDFHETQTVVKLSLGKHNCADSGTVTLVFNKNPLRLVQWIIVDFQNQRTVVNLRNVKLNTLQVMDTDPTKLIPRNL